MVRRSPSAVRRWSDRGFCTTDPFGTAKNGRELTVSHIRLQLLLLPPSRRHQLLKLMATLRHLMAGDAALSLRIDCNTTEEDNDKLEMSNFKFNYI